VDGVPPQAALPGAGQGLPAGRVHPQGAGGDEHRPPAHRQNPRVHHHHRGDEKRLWRAAAPQPALDARRDPRYAGGPADDPAGDSPRHLCRDGRHLCRRWPGPRAMRWHEKDILLASADQVAIDAVSAKLQGFDPMGIRFIRKAHEMGLGVGDPRQIEIVGYDIEQEGPVELRPGGYLRQQGQKLIYHGPLKPLEKPLLQSPLVPWSYFASNFYHNVYWYPFVGRQRVEAALQTLGTAVQVLRRWAEWSCRAWTSRDCWLRCTHRV
jgi:hypothetical protein